MSLLKFFNFFSCRKKISEPSSRQPIFDGFSDLITNDQEQQIRLLRADDPYIYVKDYDSEKSSAIVSGSSGNEYITTFSSCTCEDFQKRHLPCKHMYKLAMYTGKLKPEEWYHGLHSFTNKNIDPERDLPRNLHGNNMSLKSYKIKAIYRYTRKPRTIKNVYAISENDAIKYIGEDFILPIISIEEIGFPPPTQSQLIYAKYLGIHIPEICSSNDLSFLIDNEGFNEAPKSLIDFAISKRLLFSKYITEKSLIKFLSAHLENDDYLLFLVALIDRTINKSWNFSKLSTYEKIVSSIKNDKQFINSVKRSISIDSIKNDANRNYYKIIVNFLKEY